MDAKMSPISHSHLKETGTAVSTRIEKLEIFQRYQQHFLIFKYYP